MTEARHLRTEAPFIYDTDSINGAMRNLVGDLTNLVAAMMVSERGYETSSNFGGVCAGLYPTTNAVNMSVSVRSGVVLRRPTTPVASVDKQSQYALSILDEDSQVTLGPGGGLARVDVIALRTVSTDQDSRLMPRKGSTAANVNTRRGLVTTLVVYPGVEGGGAPVVDDTTDFPLFDVLVPAGATVSDNCEVTYSYTTRWANTMVERTAPIRYMFVGTHRTQTQVINITKSSTPDAPQQAALSWSALNWPGAYRIPDPVDTDEKAGEFFYMMAPGTADERKWWQADSAMGAATESTNATAEWSGYEDATGVLLKGLSSGTSAAQARFSVPVPGRSLRLVGAAITIAIPSGFPGGSLAEVNLVRVSVTTGAAQIIANQSLNLAVTTAPVRYVMAMGSTPVLNQGDFLYWAVSVNSVIDASSRLSIIGGEVQFQEGQTD